MNVVNNKREVCGDAEDGIKTEDDEIIDNLHHRYIGNEFNCQYF